MKLEQLQQDKEIITQRDVRQIINTSKILIELKKDSHRNYFLPRVNITNYNVLIDGRNFYDQPINDQMRKYDEIRKIATGQGDYYTTGCSSDYQYF